MVDSQELDLGGGLDSNQNVPEGPPKMKNENAGQHSAIAEVLENQHGDVSAALNLSPTLEALNDGLGKLISNLDYDGYRSLAGILLLLRIEEDYSAQKARWQDGIPSSSFGDLLVSCSDLLDSFGKKKVLKTREQRLIQFVRTSSHENIRKMQLLLEQRISFEEPDIMLQLILLTRLYYKKGVNMLNPESATEGKMLRDDKSITVRVGSSGPILAVEKLDGRAVASYFDDREQWTQISLIPGKIYVFGRGSHGFTVRNCPQNLEGILGDDGALVSIMPIPTLSRAGIAVEVQGDQVFFYDRASKNTLSFSWEKFSPKGTWLGGHEGISQYTSESFESGNGDVRLGSSQILDN